MAVYNSYHRHSFHSTFSFSSYQFSFAHQKFECEINATWNGVYWFTFFCTNINMMHGFRLKHFITTRQQILLNFNNFQPVIIYKLFIFSIGVECPIFMTKTAAVPKIGPDLKGKNSLNLPMVVPIFPISNKRWMGSLAESVHMCVYVRVYACLHRMHTCYRFDFGLLSHESNT